MFPDRVVRDDGSWAQINFNNDAPGGAATDQPVQLRLIDIVSNILKTDLNIGQININSTTGGQHAVGSDHYFGLAIDINIVNTYSVNSSNSDATEFLNAASQIRMFVTYVVRALATRADLPDLL